MTDLDVIVSKLHSIEESQRDQGEDIKELSKSFSVLAAQSEQINNIQMQVSALWNKYDSLTGADSVMEKLREHQKGCPKEEVHRTFNWMWSAIGVHSIILMGIITALISMATK